MKTCLFPLTPTPFWLLAALLILSGGSLPAAPFGAGQARVSWVPNTPGFVLQETRSLEPAN